MNRRTPVTALIALLAASGLGSSYAARLEANDALLINSASISLSQAIAAAEQHVGGKAARADFDQHKGQALFDIEVVKDTKIMDVKIDPANGKVISSAEHQEGHDGGHDENNDGGDDEND